MNEPLAIYTNNFFDSRFHFPAREDTHWVFSLLRETRKLDKPAFKKPQRRQNQIVISPGSSSLLHSSIIINHGGRQEKYQRQASCRRHLTANGAGTEVR
jgi:hypothetical protein